MSKRIGINKLLIILILMIFSMISANSLWAFSQYDHPLGRPGNKRKSYWDRKKERNKKKESNYSIKANLPIILTGDYVEYLVDEERVVAKGSAEARHDKMDLIANNIEADTKNQVVFAQGNVIFWQKMEDGKLKKITGDFLVYHIATGDGFMKDAVIYQDPMQIRSDIINLSARKIEAPEGAIWTSDYRPNPQWSIRAKKITIYPNDKMIMENAGYYIGNTKLLSLSRHVMDIRKHGDRDFQMKMGYTKVKGFYQFLKWHYRISDNNWGDFDYNSNAKHGTFLNVLHNFKMKSRWNGQIGTNYSEYSDKNEINQRSIFNGNVRLNKTANLRYNVSENYIKQNGVATHKDLNSSLNLNYRTKNYSVTGRYKKDTDLLKNPNNMVRTLDYVPELTITTTRKKFYKTPFFLSTRNIIGTRNERSGGVSTKRNIFDSTWKLDSSRIKFSKNTNFNINSSYQIKRTNEDEKQSVLNGGATYTIKMGDTVNGNIRYNNTRTYGLSPFKTSTINNQNKLNINFTMNKKKEKYDKSEFRSNLFQAYYDLDKNRFSNVSNDITWTWRKSAKHYWRLYLRGNYDYGDTILKNFYGGSSKLKSIYIKYDLKDSDNLSFNASTTYDRILKKYKTLNSRTTFRLNPFWKINTDVIFDLQSHKLRTINYIFERDLHCFFMKFTARVKQKEYYMEFGLKAFPSDSQKFTKSKETGKWKREKTQGKYF